MTRFLQSCASLLLAAALMLSLSACDSGGSNEEDDAPDVEEGRVEVSIDGDASGSFDGYAYFSEVTDSTGQTMFSIVLSNTDDETPSGQNAQWVWIARESDRPSVGQHTFAQINQGDNDLKADEFISVAWSVASDVNTIGLYYSNGGTLTITKSSENNVAGTFEINAVGSTWSENGQSTEEVNVTLEGAFDAEPVNAYFNPWMN